jgi:hypothetical protein
MRRITFWIIVFIFSLLFAAQRAHAQQGKDLLKELDEKPPAEQGKKPEAETAGKAAKAWNPLDQLQKNFEGSAGIRAISTPPRSGRRRIPNGTRGRSCCDSPIGSAIKSCAWTSPAGSKPERRRILMPG